MLYFASDDVLEPVLILSKTDSAVQVRHGRNEHKDMSRTSAGAEVARRFFSHCRAEAQVRLHMHIGL